MASVAAGRAAPRADHSLRERLTPAEGWVTVLLHATVVVAAAWAVARAGWAPHLTGLIPVAVLGVAAGLVQAKARLPDMLAHIVAVVLGVAVSVAATLATADDLGVGWRTRLRTLAAQARHWYDQAAAGKQVGDRDLFVLVMAMTLWLVAYSSAWMLYRRRWLSLALLAPGVMVLINLSYAPQTGTAPLLVYLLAAGVLAARHFVFRRQQEWQRFQIPAPARLPWHFLNAGITITLLVVLLGWSLPLTNQDDLIQRGWQRIDGPWQSLAQRWNDWLGSFNVPGRSGGGTYTEFGESFRLGGALNLGDQPVAILKAPASAYLVGHTYDYYDGHGWRSDVNSTFNPDGGNGRHYAPQVTFEPMQRVHLSQDVMQSTTESDAIIKLISPKQDLLLTVGTYEMSNQATSVQLSWRQLDDEPFDVQNPDYQTLPPDLFNFVQLLQATHFAPGSDGAPVATDPALERQIENSEQDLQQRFIHVRWTLNPDGTAATLYVTGQVPVYDDVEAVFDQTPTSSGMTYTVVGRESDATPAELRGAGEDYPGYVSDRYLELPTTITTRTRELARQVTAGLDNPFDEAVAIQNFVRDRITYNENIKDPPANQDVVDYVLFDSKQGYCEYYASAMTVMLRTLGIPARMVVGYYPAPMDANAGGYLYREANAHAWVQVYFPGYGWIPFEPTAARPPLDYGADPSQRVPQPTPTPPPAATPSATTNVAAPTPTPAVAAKPSTRNGGGSLFGGNPGPLGWASRIGGGTLLLLIVVALLVWVWGLRGLSPAGSLYARAIRLGRWLGVRRDPAMTPTEFADELGRSVPAARAPAHVLAELYVAEQYGGYQPTPGSARTGRAAWRQLRRLFWRRWLGRRARGGGRRA